MLCFFAVCGIFHILYTISLCVAKSDMCIPEKSHKVIYGIENAENLESYIRYISMKDDSEKIILVSDTDDSESNEKYTLLLKLCKEFSNTELMTYNEYFKYIKE